MPLIRTSCPTCHRSIDLEPRSMVLLPASPHRMARALFWCPACHDEAALRVDTELAEVLRAVGARVSWHPALLQRQMPRSEAPPFTHDDLLEFHELLERPDWFEELTRR